MKPELLECIALLQAHQREKLAEEAGRMARAINVTVQQRELLRRIQFALTDIDAVFRIDLENVMNTYMQSAARKTLGHLVEIMERHGCPPDGNIIEWLEAQLVIAKGE